MATISDIVTVAELVTKATKLVLDLPDTWYKRSSELKNFKSNLKTLRLQTVQWKAQLDQFGMSEDPILKDLLHHAATLLNREDDYFETHRNKCAWKFRKRLFPAKLTSILNEILTIVETGPRLLATRVETHKLLAKSLPMRPSPLPFGYDPKYIPLSGVVDEVQRALEFPKGPQVVTLYGTPGIGKSSLAKYVALHYEESIRGSRPCPFNSVQYLFCGQGCRSKIRQLQKDLLSNLGLLVSEPVIHDQDGDQNMSFYRRSMRNMLIDRQLLIVLDDVWKEDCEALVNLISRGNGIRYLVTSQTRGIWIPARNIEVSKPNDEHALQMLISHTEGLSIDQQAPVLPKGLEMEIRQIIRKLDNHPLSLVNVAVSVRPHQATNSDQWKFIAQNIYAYLDVNHYHSRILVHERPYSISVTASMMLMVEALPSPERLLLFLIAMIEHKWFRNGIPAVLIKMLFRRLHHDSPDYNYLTGMKNLEDNSLVQVHSRDSADMSCEQIQIHGLRRHYIRRNNMPVLRRIASDIVAPQGDQGRRLLQATDGDDSLVVVLSALYCHHSLAGEVAQQFLSMMKDRNGGVIPRSMEQDIDAHEVVKSAKYNPAGFLLVGVVKFLLPNLEGHGDWKQHVRADVNKMVMKLVCKHELDDEIMASLLMFPHTTAAARLIFHATCRYICRDDLRYRFYFGEPKSLSDTHPKTWRALSDLWDKSITFTEIQSSSFHPGWIITFMLEFEPEWKVLTELEKKFQIAEQCPDPRLRKVIATAFLWLHESRLTCQILAHSGLEDLPTILWRMIQGFNELQSYNNADSWKWEQEDDYQIAMECVRGDKGYALKLLTFPISCDKWFTDGSILRPLLRFEQRFGPLSLLGVLSGTPEFEARVVEVLKEGCCPDFTRWPESYDGRLARFWGNVALVKDLHQTTRLKLVQIAQSWVAKLIKNGRSACFCTCSCSNEKCGCRPRCHTHEMSGPIRNYCGDGWDIGWSVYEVTRTVTIIRHLQVDSNSSLDIPTLEGPQQNLLLRMGQSRAYDQMKMYPAAIASLELVQQQLLSIDSIWRREISQNLRSHMIFVKAMAGDYYGSMELANQYYDDRCSVIRLLRRGSIELADRAVLFSLYGEFSKAISEFDRSLECWEGEASRHDYVRDDPRIHNFIKYRLLAHRGYAKQMAGDHEGSQVDMRSALELKERKLLLEPASWEYLFPFPFHYTRSSWASSVGMAYSLLQLPVVHNNFLL